MEGSTFLDARWLQTRWIQGEYNRFTRCFALCQIEFFPLGLNLSKSVLTLLRFCARFRDLGDRSAITRLLFDIKDLQKRYIFRATS